MIQIDRCDFNISNSFDLIWFKNTFLSSHLFFYTCCCLRNVTLNIDREPVRCKYQRIHELLIFWFACVIGFAHRSVICFYSIFVLFCMVELYFYFIFLNCMVITYQFDMLTLCKTKRQIKEHRFWVILFHLLISRYVTCGSILATEF